MSKTKKTFTIEGMHCSSCAMTIDFDLEDLAGVTKAVTSYARQETVVEFEEEKISVSDIVGQIQKSGYIAKKKDLNR